MDLAVQEMRGALGQTVDPVLAEAIRKNFALLYDGSRSARFFYSQFWCLGIAMCEGQQWLEESISSTSKGSRVLRAYPERYDPGIDAVRATLNLTRPMTSDIAAMVRVDPVGWALRFDPDPRDAMRGAIDLLISDRVWQHFRSHRTVDIAGEVDVANQWRCQTGAGLLKVVPDTANPYGRSIIHVPNDRMIWDVGITTPEVTQHNEWADTMAWPAAEVERRYGFQFTKKTKENLPTLGDLRQFDEMVQAIRSLQPAGYNSSKTPAVLVTEYYFDLWQKMAILVHTGTGSTQSHVVWVGPNPYGYMDESGKWVGLCPFLKLDFSMSLLGPWGPGVPHIIRTPQQITNLVYTNFLRNLLATSAPHYLYEEGTIADPNTAFSPRIGAPIEWKRARPDSQAPGILRTAEIPSIVNALASAMPQVMADMAHVSPVLQGIQSSDKASAQAIQIKLAQAQRPFSAMEEKDSEKYTRFFSDFTRVLVNSAPAEVLLEAVGQDLKSEADEMLSQNPRLKSRLTVSIPRDAIHPRTTAEKRQDLVQAAQLQLMSPQEYRYELAKQLGHPLTSKESIVLANVARENLMFLAGATADQVDATHFEDHDLHIRGHQTLLDSRWTANVSPDVQEQLRYHIFDHLEEKSDEAEVQGAMVMAAQGQIGATEAAMQQTGGGPPMATPMTPLGGSMMSAGATPAAYAGREAQRTAEQVPMAGG